MSISGVFGSLSISVAAATSLVGAGAGSAGTCITGFGSQGYINVIQNCRIPGGALGVGGYAQVSYELSSSITSGSNQFYTTFAGVTIGSILAIGAGQYKGSFNIRNQNNSVVLVTSPTLQMGSLSATAVQAISANMAIDQMVQFAWAAGVATNGNGLKGWSVECHNQTATAAPAGLLPGRKCFYGINAHIDEGNGPPIATRISAMKAMGFNVLRVSWFGRSHSSGGVLATTWIQDMASAFAADTQSLNLNMMVMVGCGPYSATGVIFANETDAYANGFAQGSAAAFLMGPKGVQLYELGNETDADALIRRIPTTQGTVVDDFSTGSIAAWNAWRGNMRGCYDGIKSVQPTAMVGSNAFVNASIWASDALWNGTDPAGGKGNPVVRWDWTNWHTYTEDDMTTVAYSGGQTGPVKFNMLQYLHNAYGVPICITEYNPAEATTASTNAHTVAWMTTWFNTQTANNIASLVWFSWFDGPYNIAITSAPTVVNSMGQTLIDFISAHPAVK